MASLWRRLRRKRIPLSELNTADIMATKSSLEGSVDSWETVAHVFTALVAAGLIIEYREPFVDFVKTHDWQYIARSIGGVLVTIGVAGELLAGFRSTAKDGELREANSVLALKAAETIAASNERIAELNLETERLRREANDTALVLADRTIIDDADFDASLNPFSGTRYRLHIIGKNEARQFEWRISEALKRCGWILVADPIRRNNLYTGVMVVFNSPKEGFRSQSADALTDWLDTHNVAVMEAIWTATDPAESGIVDIMIGSKPENITGYIAIRNSLHYNRAHFNKPKT